MPDFARKASRTNQPMELPQPLLFLNFAAYEEETRLVIINIIKKQRHHQYQHQLSLNV
jgi:hypothetical protein